MNFQMIQMIMMILIAIFNVAILLLILKRDTFLKDFITKFTERQKFVEENITLNLKRYSEDLNTNFKYFRDDMKDSFKSLSDFSSANINTLTENQRKGFEDFNNKLLSDTKKNEERLEKLQVIVSDSLKEIINAQAKFETEIGKKIKELTEVLNKELKDSRGDLNKTLTLFENKIDESLEKVRRTLTETLEKLRNDNEKKLEEMRKTVDEKLQETLEIRLANSFKIVSERLEQVHKGLGEMQNLANGVGDLKKALTNIKNRGIIGEIQLRQILEQILFRGQYEENVKVKPHSNEVVEFAIKLPGEDEKHPLFLPIDSKFPVEDYYRLLDAIDKGDAEAIQMASKQLENRVRQSAKEIASKYIEVPYTTDFAILFLPFEGLYSEVLRINGLFESLQRDYKVVITGPTTMAAFLSSLQMGFKTLNVEKTAHKVMTLLGIVKSEFSKFGGVLEKAQKKIKEAGDSIDTLVGTRTKKIQKALEDVETNSTKSIDEF